MIHRVAAALALAALLVAAGQAGAQADTDDAALRHSVEQLRSAIGHWDVSTDFLKPDGTVARSVRGSYAFSWVVPDRVVAGRSDIPELKQSSGILFYVNAAQRRIEMVSVGADGRLWVMSGALGEEVRRTEPFKTAKGDSRLRFTRFNVTADTFESRMEYLGDDGKTWLPGNHQRFRRVAGAGAAASSPR